MIQSMEILQLPILALQERIEQEMEENPILELQEEEPEPPPEGDEAEERPAGRRPHRGRARAGDRRDPLERGRFRAADEDGRGVARPLRGAFARLARRDRRGRRAQDRRDGQHGRPAAVAAGLSARPVGLVRPRARACGRWPTASSTTSTRNGYLQGRLEDLLGADAGDGANRPWPQRALALVQKLDPPGVGARDLRECLLLQLVPGIPYYEQLRTLDRQPSGGLGAQPPADDFAQDGLFDRVDPERCWSSCGS